MFAKPSRITISNKKDILLAALKGYEDHLLHLSSGSANLALTISSGLIAFPFLLSRSEKALPVPVAVILSIAISVVALLAIWTVRSYAKHYTWLCRAITRVKQALGLFEEGIFMNEEDLRSPGHIHWFPGTAILPTESQSWGDALDMSASYAYAASISAAFLASLALLWSQTHVGEILRQSLF